MRLRTVVILVPKSPDCLVVGQSRLAWGAVLVTIVRVFAVIFVLLGLAVAASPAQGDTPPQQVVISNASGTSFTVSWVTVESCNGYVVFGTTPGDLGQAAYDVRDNGAGQPRYRSTVHYVDVDNAGLGLASGATYFFRVISNGSTFGNGAQPW
jgi:hypothetical protein